LIPVLQRLLGSWCQAVMRLSRCAATTDQKVAIGLIGDPVPRVGSGAAVNRNS